MDNLYQKTFDQLHMPDQRRQSLRAELASRCSHDEMEAIPMKTNQKIRRPIVALVAVFLISALSVTAFAYGDQIREIFFHISSTSFIEHGVDEDGNSYTQVSFENMNTTETTPVEVREDGRLYFLADGQETDITDLCSYTTPYVYESTDQDGNRHILIVGGELDAIGYAEFIMDPDGQPMGGISQFGTSEGAADAPWLDAAKADLNLPW